MSGFRRTLRMRAAGHEVLPGRLGWMQARQRMAVDMTASEFRLADSVHAARNLDRIIAAGPNRAEQRARSIERIAAAAVTTVRAAFSFGRGDFVAGVALTAMSADALAAGAAMLGLPPSEPPPP